MGVSQHTIIYGRDPNKLPRVIEVNENGYLAGVECLIEHVPTFAGTVWNVIPTAPAGGDGTAEHPFTTIGAAIAACAAGDAISIGAGTYTEVGLDLNKNAVEMWFEIGAIIAPAAGTALTVSGDYCKLQGEHRIIPAALQTGLLVSGAECVINDAKIVSGAIGVQVTGAGVVLNQIACGLQTSIAYDLQGAQGRLYRCHTIGAGATMGYKISTGADKGVLESCTSAGHATSSFYIDTGSQDWTILNCSSGAKDGRWVDTDSANVWSNFSYDNEVFHTTTFTGSGPSSDNIFKISGCVEIHYLLGGVETALSADVDNIYLDLWDGTVSVEITDNGGGGTDTNSADVGSIFVKSEIATSPITLMQSNQCRVEENDSFRDPRTPFIVNQKKDTDTYIRVVYSGVATGGAIHWHCQWIPLVEDGFVEAV